MLHPTSSFNQLYFSDAMGVRWSKGNHMRQSSIIAVDDGSNGAVVAMDEHEKKVQDALVIIVKHLDRHNIPYAICGSIGLRVHLPFVFTRPVHDIDLSIFLPDVTPELRKAVNEMEQSPGVLFDVYKKSWFMPRAFFTQVGSVGVDFFLTPLDQPYNTLLTTQVAGTTVRVQPLLSLLKSKMDFFRPKDQKDLQLLQIQKLPEFTPLNTFIQHKYGFCKNNQRTIFLNSFHKT
jgi:hypothetical protein